MPQCTWLRPLTFVMYIDDLNPQCVVLYTSSLTTQSSLRFCQVKLPIAKCHSTWTTYSPGLKTTVWSLIVRRQIKWFLVLPTNVHLLFSLLVITRFKELTCFKLLGINLCNDLRWDTHVDALCSKVASRSYFLKLLKRSGLLADDLLCFYKSVIRSVL